MTFPSKKLRKGVDKTPFLWYNSIRKEDEKMKCNKCRHVTQETTDDVASCNCCDNGEFFDPVEEEEEDPFHENDPYVVTNPMAFY